MEEPLQNDFLPDASTRVSVSVPAAATPGRGIVDAYIDPNTNYIVLEMTDGSLIQVGEAAPKVKSVAITADNEFVFTYQDDSTYNAGVLDISAIGITAADAQEIADTTVSEASTGIRWQTYRHVQSVPASSWTIAHNLGCWPSVTVIDSAGSVVIGKVSYISNNQVLLEFASPFSGEAFIN